MTRAAAKREPRRRLSQRLMVLWNFCCRLVGAVNLSPLNNGVPQLKMLRVFFLQVYSPTLVLSRSASGYLIGVNQREVWRNQSEAHDVQLMYGIQITRI